MFFKKLLISNILLTIALSSSFAKERPIIRIGKAGVKQSSLAILPTVFLGTPGLNKKHLMYGNQLHNVLVKDLQVSSYFSLIPQQAFQGWANLQALTPKSGAAMYGFDFLRWQEIGAEFMIRSQLQTEKNKITFKAYLYHVPTRGLVFASSYVSSVENIRIVGHKFCNDVLFKLTGKKGFFLTKILVSRSTRNHEKEIFLMDWDGAHSKAITHHQTISQSPSWSPNGRYMTYTSFLYHRRRRSRNADLFLHDFQTKKSWLLSYRTGINSGGAFTPDSLSVVFRISRSGSSNLYKTSLNGKSKPVALTRNTRGVMNVEPAISPNGQTIAFSSDRSGRPMIYTMNSNGTGVQRRTYAGVYNSSPAWSPDGKLIAFAGYDKSHFDVFTMKSDGTQIKRLTSARKRNGHFANNEYPSFSPDGRFILFSSNRSGKYQLWVVSVDGRYEYRITFDNYNYYKPQWSPYLNP